MPEAWLSGYLLNGLPPERGLYDIGPLEPAPRAVADMQYFHLLLLFQHAVDRATNMRLVAVEQMPELVTLGRQRALVRLLFQTENRLLEPAIPFQGSVEILSVDLPVEESEIALGAGGEVNEVCHA